MKPSTNTAPKLRSYQAALIQGIYEAWHRGDRRVLAQLPTGGGKTNCFAAIASEFACRGERVLILAHRQELIHQAASKLRAASGVSVGLIKSGEPKNLSAPIQVASVQTLVNRPNLLKDVALVIIDESHHATAGTYRKILGWFPDAYLLGVTATPARLDGSGFDDLFDVLVTGPSVGELTDQGFLCPLKLFADPEPMTVKGVRTRQGDFSVNDLARENNITELSGNLIRAYRQHSYGKRCITFCITVEHSKAIAERYRRSGIPAVHLDANTPPEVRAEALEMFAAGNLWVICNVGLFDEGLDVPGIEAVQVARPTKSLSKWLQMLGRALRPADGKAYAIALDHTQNYRFHGLPTRPRIWTLEGVQQGESRRVAVKPNGEVSDEPETQEIEELEEQQLQEITLDPLAEWRDCFQDLVSLCQSRAYKPSWIVYRLRDLKPPIEVWEWAAKWLGYKTGWAFYQHKQYTLGEG